MTPQNEPPKIPSLKPVQKDEEKKSGSGPLASTGKPATSTGFRFPGLGKGGMPNLRVRGLPSGTSVIDRLKNLRKKDMMFIFAGLAVLCMAPLAEHFMMSPEEEAGKLQEGFDSKGPLFPDGTTIYENGTGGFSPGGLVGAGTDVITPLNVRDPSALIMGPGATRKPEAVVAPPPAAPEKPEPATDWKHALAESAKSGTKAAVSKAKLPMPSVKMSGALRGLSAGGGGTSAGMTLSAPNAGNVPSRAKESNSLTTSKAAPGYRGASKRSTDMATGADGLKNAGNRQGDILNRGGSAAGNLENASKETVPGGGGAGSGSGNPTKDADGKSPSHKKPDDNKSLGESLEYLRQKTEMQKALELKWKRKEWEEFGRGKMIEESVIKLALDNFLGKGIFEPIGKAIGKTFEQTMAGGAGKTTYYRCMDAAGKATIYDEGQVLEQVGSTGLRLKSDVSKEGNVIQCPGGVEVIGPGSSGTPPTTPSDQSPGGQGGVQTGPGGGVNTPPWLGGMTQPLIENCKALQSAQGPVKESLLKSAQGIATATKNLVYLGGGGDLSACLPADGGNLIPASLRKDNVNSVADALGNVRTRLIAAQTKMQNMLKGESTGESKSAKKIAGEAAGKLEGGDKLTGDAKTIDTELGKAIAALAPKAGVVLTADQKTAFDAAVDAAIKAAGEAQKSGLGGLPGLAAKDVKPLDTAMDELVKELKDVRKMHADWNQQVMVRIEEKLGESGSKGSLTAAKAAIDTEPDVDLKKTYMQYYTDIVKMQGFASDAYTQMSQYSTELTKYHDLGETALQRTGRAVDAVRMGLGVDADGTTVPPVAKWSSVSTKDAGNTQPDAGNGGVQPSGEVVNAVLNTPATGVVPRVVEVKTKHVPSMTDATVNATITSELAGMQTKIKDEDLVKAKKVMTDITASGGPVELAAAEVAKLKPPEARFTNPVTAPAK